MRSTICIDIRKSKFLRLFGGAGAFCELSFSVTSCVHTTGKYLKFTSKMVAIFGFSILGFFLGFFFFSF